LNIGKQCLDVDVHTHITVFYMLVKSCLEFRNHLILLSAHFTQIWFPLPMALQSLKAAEQVKTSLQDFCNFWIKKGGCLLMQNPQWCIA